MLTVYILSAVLSLSSLIRHSFQASYVTCNLKPLSWAVAHQECLKAKGKPVSINHGVHQLGLKPALRVWTSDFLTVTDTTTIPANNSSKVRVLCQYNTVTVDNRGRYSFSSADFGDCNAQNHYVHCSTDTDPSIKRGTWMVANQEECGIITENTIDELEGDPGRYWTKSVRLFTHKTAKSISDLSIKQTHACGIYPSMIVKNSTDVSMFTLCSASFLSLCKFSAVPNNSLYSDLCFDKNPTSPPEKASTSKAILIAVPVTVVLVLLLVVATVVIVFQHKRLRVVEKCVKPHSGISGSGGHRRAHLSPSNASYGLQATNEVQSLSSKTVSKTELLESQEENRDTDSAADVVQLGSSESQYYQDVDGATADGVDEESYSYATLERRLTDESNRSETMDAGKSETPYVNVKSKLRQIHAMRRSKKWKPSRRGVPGNALSDDIVRAVGSRMVFNESGERGDDYDTTVRTTKIGITGNVYNTLELGTAGNYNSTFIKPRSGTEYNCTYSKTKK